ncbi:hypothetical protein GH714_000735 [Hevea brasiliensis]|uniref:Uncharacterized protein n=1 Tax=Hevea brasiliensis TaxID=3981 RepID=A0A6A6M657_HEVBR|nr:hypothetical protein GH714_000735 [Hevea brasiliensis]
MVFKNKLFFSSKKSDTSSPDGSNSPRSIGSNSPIRSDKKKPKSSSKDESPTAHNTGFAAAACRQTQVKDGVKKKDSFKGKESAAQSPGRLGLSSSGSKKPASATAADGKNAAASVSPILASSLGLNKIKTRSGPLPQESFFSFRGDKGSGVLGSSNLSKPGVGGGVSGGSSSSSGSGKKKEIVGQSRMMGFQGVVSVIMATIGIAQCLLEVGSLESMPKSLSCWEVGGWCQAWAMLNSLNCSIFHVFCEIYGWSVSDKFEHLGIGDETKWGRCESSRGRSGGLRSSDVLHRRIMTVKTQRSLNLPFSSYTPSDKCA